MLATIDDEDQIGVEVPQDRSTVLYQSLSVVFHDTYIGGNERKCWPLLAFLRNLQATVTPMWIRMHVSAWMMNNIFRLRNTLESRKRQSWGKLKYSTLHLSTVVSCCQPQHRLQLPRLNAMHMFINRKWFLYVCGCSFACLLKQFAVIDFRNNDEDMQYSFQKMTTKALRLWSHKYPRGASKLLKYFIPAPRLR